MHDATTAQAVFFLFRLRCQLRDTSFSTIFLLRLNAKWCVNFDWVVCTGVRPIFQPEHGRRSVGKTDSVLKGYVLSHRLICIESPLTGKNRTTEPYLVVMGIAGELVVSV